MNTKIQYTFSTSAEEVRATIQAVKQSKVSFVIYFASSRFDFEFVTKEVNKVFNNTPNIGCVSMGEIYPKGEYSQGSFVIISVYSEDFKVKPILLKNLTKKVMLYKRQVVKAVEDIGLKPTEHKKMFMISLIDYFAYCEDRLGTMLKTVFKTGDINLVGGSAGDLDKGKEAYVAVNGEIQEDACALMFVNSTKKIETMYENIYEPFGEKYRVTKADLETSTIYEVNNEKFVDLYCRNINISKDDLNFNTFAKNPIGRVQDDKTLISSPKLANPDGSIQFCSKVVTGRQFNLMQPMPLLDVTRNTVDRINSKFKKVDLALGFSCVLRYIQIKDEGAHKDMYGIVSSGINAPYVGITTLGEQIGTYHVNQTLTLLVIGD